MAILKRSIKISGHETSITLEQEFWDVLKQMARDNGQSLNTIISEIDSARKDENLSSAIRVFILKKLLLQSKPSE